MALYSLLREDPEKSQTRRHPRSVLLACAIVVESLEDEIGGVSSTFKLMK